MTEPAAVTVWRTMLLACPSVAALNMLTAAFPYPEAAPVADNEIAPTNTYPYAVLAETSERRRRFLSVGAQGLQSGSVIAVFHFDGSVTDIGTVEAFAVTIKQDLFLCTAASVLPLSEVECILAAKPEPGETAANATQSGASDISLQVTADYGLSA